MSSVEFTLHCFTFIIPFEKDTTNENASLVSINAIAGTEAILMRFLRYECGHLNYLNVGHRKIIKFIQTCLQQLRKY